eukprot:TRINITY_DN3056_c0_g1_i1.p1 TRINITY_DN3056_c0_g1~~TRINITY_DN3056_c0_g1_i1.p1  ORF type:complete len:178 (+),score=46.10 TRINITY_DN3056_c0_g1_i1:100-633(+)
MEAVEQSVPSQESTANLTKTQESYINKGDKSYYYWHPHVSNKVVVEPPPLLKKEEKSISEIHQALEIQPEHLFKKISHYSWMDDDETVKVMVELEKIGDLKDGAPELEKDNINCTFTSNSFDLRLKGYKGGDHRLYIGNLKEEVEPEACVFRWKKRITVSLKKKDPTKSWYDLTNKK